jgi:hypothetical protein
VKEMLKDYEKRAILDAVDRLHDAARDYGRSRGYNDAMCEVAPGATGRAKILSRRRRDHITAAAAADAAYAKLTQLLEQAGCL